MFCKECGAEIPDDTKHCSECGASLVDDSINKSEVVQSNSVEKESFFQKKQSTCNYYILLVTLYKPISLQMLGKPLYSMSNRHLSIH